MDNYAVLIGAGFLIGTVGTLIGAGGGFILIPILFITHPQLSPEVVTGISMAIVACNAVSGSVAYARLGRIDYKAGLIFAAFTIPGSILGVYTTKYIPQTVFHLAFGLLLILIAILLFFKKQSDKNIAPNLMYPSNLKHHTIRDKAGNIFSYTYNQNTGILISIVVGYISPLLGIGGGIIHVPALINLLRFPVSIATATSHFILATMATVSVVVHFMNGNYDDPQILRLVIFLGIGAVVGAQMGAFLSHKIRGSFIIRTLAVCLGIVGFRILIGTL